MEKKDVEIIFKEKITFGRIILPDKSFVEVDFFTWLFKDAPSHPTYAELVEIDGGLKGYIPFFDECKKEGVLV